MERCLKLLRLSATLFALLYGFLLQACSAENNVDPPGWPDPRNMHSAAYIPSTGEMLIFGGTTNAGETNTLWSFKENRWTLLSKDGPQAREDALLIHNSDDQATYLIGGRHNGTSTIYSDMWKWDGTKWSQVPGTLPFMSLTHGAGCYDKTNKRILIFGGIKNGQLSNQLWSWNGSTWTSSNAEPSTRLAASLVYSEDDDKVYLFGGSLHNGTVLNDVWSLENTSWQKVNENFPPVMNSAYGVTSYGKGFLLYGGFAPSGQQSADTWTFDPTANTWSKSGATGPGPRALHSLVLDTNSNTVLMFGGGSAGVMLDEVWKFNGTWSKIEKSK